jgi:hypothetical protein
MKDLAASDLQEHMRLKNKLSCLWTPSACGEARALLHVVALNIPSSRLDFRLAVDAHAAGS